ncbi:unnamed protein product [Rotaria sp. Silwood1]|nr:unnamed protein product [Rotaria sp. Silwood1]
MTTSAIIMFGFQNENNREYYLDTVSVVDNSASTIQLLNNPNFENSTTTATSWVQWCTSTCSSVSGQITSGTNCYLPTGNCFMDGCDAPGIDFLGQSFSTLIGHNYTVSFWLKLSNGGFPNANRFYADIV